MDDPASYLFALFADQPQASGSLFKVLIKLASVLFFVLANGFFVGAEFALVSVRRQRLEARAATGSKRADAAIRLLNDPTPFISATQLGITIASLALGWIGEPSVPSLLEPAAAAIASEGRAAYVAHGVAIAIAFAAITFLHIVLGELMPKMIALQHSAVYSEAELRQLVDISRESGHLRAEERRLIHRVFEFSDTVVREAMVPRTEMAAIPSTCDLEQIAKSFDQNGYSRLPVYRETLDDVIGFIHS